MEFIPLLNAVVGLSLLFFSIYRMKRFHRDAVRVRSEIYNEPVRPVDRIHPPVLPRRSHTRPEDIAYRRYFLSEGKWVAFDVVTCMSLFFMLGKLRFGCC